MRTVVIFEKYVDIAGATVGSINSEAAAVWHIQKQPHGIEVVTHDHGTVLVPWHNVRCVKYTG